MEQSSNLSYKVAIGLTVNNYDLSILNKTHSKLNKTMQLTETQTKAIKILAKADARPVEQMLQMVLKEGFYWVFNEHSCEQNTPYLGWPDEWKEISDQLDNEYKKAMEVD